MSVCWWTSTWIHPFSKRPASSLHNHVQHIWTHLIMILANVPHASFQLISSCLIQIGDWYTCWQPIVNIVGLDYRVQFPLIVTLLSDPLPRRRKINGNVTFGPPCTFWKESISLICLTHSFLKLVHIFSVNPHLGPLQVSLGRMVLDILKFFFIYALVVFSFGCGMNQLLWYYADMAYRQCQRFPEDERSPHEDGPCKVWRRFSKWALFRL